MSETAAPAKPIVLSKAAAKRITAIATKRGAPTALRVSVEGGGCSGFSYKFELTADSAPDDLVVEADGAKVLVDPVSLDFMRGSVIDFVDDLMGQAFQVQNPNATSSCGCGTSFSI
ncbi:iron-sulfur cluster insertion protein ErpA [Consotaella salsifontis]|uniref:Iron-sulfur cluster assembly accessory protein n=1 Tax=Consotaella salsifontis TaxID=1365950 RepID=A0A1T4R523_9HYPH|nr:iron-sulfur cluster insertion protein ErpA [Consotaella salsifontis]SKA10936.1 Iron-sulfur cluster assembly accessory protein [Consotaella salsifontis]